MEKMEGMEEINPFILLSLILTANICVIFLPTPVLVLRVKWKYVCGIIAIYVSTESDLIMTGLLGLTIMTSVVRVVFFVVDLFFYYNCLLIFLGFESKKCFEHDKCHTSRNSFACLFCLVAGWVA